MEYNLNRNQFLKLFRVCSQSTSLILVIKMEDKKVANPSPKMNQENCPETKEYSAMSALELCRFINESRKLAGLPPLTYQS